MLVRRSLLTAALCPQPVVGIYPRVPSVGEPAPRIHTPTAAANGDQVAFIHMEVYDENDISKGVRSQLRAFGLHTEPWTFLIDRSGIVRDRIEGGYGVFELGKAVETILPG